ncbi:hypothetical protein [Flagellimonas aequoris]|uniref:Uncharacterized protein n=1 Tax=Flagellimonas aequoris TaxID=2306997 RepID=A0A418N4A6_9FLAO|nr:hypothetical protein [Allomuricauda aequoris]RIV68682.1 hypothetical protein D2U88_15955 [Allomuricauda aequoris]TXK00381.1 hypothetical protein FQ019_15780 [Allomuricauda aequoris]
MSIRKSQVSLEVKGLDNISLLERICNENCNESYNEFVNRFYDDVFDECQKKCKSRNIDLHIGRQIAHEVFERVKKYKSFDKTKLKNAKDERKPF